MDTYSAIIDFLVEEITMKVSQVSQERLEFDVTSGTYSADASELGFPAGVFPFSFWVVGDYTATEFDIVLDESTGDVVVYRAEEGGPVIRVFND